MFFEKKNTKKAWERTTMRESGAHLHALESSSTEFAIVKINGRPGSYSIVFAKTLVTNGHSY